MMPAGKTIWKTIIAALMTVFCLSSCEQVGLYDTARDGVPLVYSLSADGVDGLLVVSNGGDYHREYVVSGYGIPASTDMLHVNGSRRAFIARANQLYTHDGDRYNESWAPHNLPNTISSLDSIGSETYMVITTSGDCLHRWDEKGKTAVSLGKTVADSPMVLRYEPALGALYVAVEQGGNTPVYLVTEQPALQLVITTPCGAPPVLSASLWNEHLCRPGRRHIPEYHRRRILFRDRHSVLCSLQRNSDLCRGAERHP
ncbi:MAG TPA: hypothetical protein ENN21_11450 [Spirochaetes bacterium]|nr:hypothetical protein [Spirochaetota bacterium]